LLTDVASFAAAFVVCESSLYLVSATGGTKDFAAAIVIRILEINAAGFAVLLAGALIGAAGSRVGALGKALTPIMSR
jgi:hypothetical protein